MKNSIPILSFIFMSLFLAGCDESNSKISANSMAMAAIISPSAEEKETATSTSITMIHLSDNVTTVENDSVIVSGNIVTITQEGEYVFSGKLSNGQVVVEAPDAEVQIMLNNVEIINTSGPAIYVKEAKNVDLILAGNTTNTVKDGKKYINKDIDNAPNAVIFSTADLKIKGQPQSTLNISGLYKDGIVSKDDMKIKNAIINITAADDGIRGKDSITIEKSTIKIIAEGDGLKSDNNEDDGRGVITLSESDIKITAGDDGIHGVQVVEVLSGNIDILKSYEGLEGKKITIQDGIINLVSSDDGLNVTGTNDTKTDSSKGGRGDMNSVLEGGLLTITGGIITINAGGDGFDSNGNAIMTGGTLIVNGPTDNGNGPLDVNGTFDISGGTIIAVGSSGMAETPSETSGQYVIQVNFEEIQEAGSEVSLQDENGNQIFSFNPEKEFQSVTYSSDEIQAGKTYNFLLGEDVYTTLVLSDIITKYGEAARMGGGDRGMRMPSNIELPENWETMTEDEQRDYMRSNRSERTAPPQ